MLHPRVPYRSDGIADPRRPAAAPVLGADNGRGDLAGPPRSRARIRGSRCGSHNATFRWSGVRVADFTAFWAGPMATQVLAALGADVIKVEGCAPPDGMRFAGGRPPSWDQWWEWGPVFLCSNTNKRGVSLRAGHTAGALRRARADRRRATSSSRTSRRG